MSLTLAQAWEVPQRSLKLVDLFLLALGSNTVGFDIKCTLYGNSKHNLRLIECFGNETRSELSNGSGAAR